ncbi:hypothetical protein HQ346_16700 [Rhodococcus sp. BP-252]|uniref:hypothetical protein n=1 Tax=unclassified Rhodococcus (in: high G+C Gram-positive bacteria) TaxID=192944 RepID=UPI001C9B517F|nr:MULTISPECIES: hypothetical protein [unclassified Rhodococcus (in: high G+C Gram-positive bacteria)]MBY6535143.1 hypothetical protein [Rhodococcus sp. BP-148]MBY6413336.1 hypothetical protein [Rhodococcus sp. BP-320]MBY6418060.1 hypothetical protein [Rhodococcus sp. BP-321]MBY6422250.1 hypothetical protein [Rhodococcus sp. BP-324]MBY6428109.1 hypothetical protein [Rhodococcus sp. BP-323]
MTMYIRPAFGLITMAIAVVMSAAACSGGDSGSTVDAADSTQTSLSVAQPGLPESGYSGQCGTDGDNLSYDELGASAFVGSGPPELLRGVVDATPAGGQRNFLDGYCAATVAAYGPDDAVSTGVILGMTEIAETRAHALLSAYDSCLIIQANRNPSETFEPDLPGTSPTNEILKVTNTYLCPQIAFPQFPS